jgi:hypothetical protein
MAILCNRDDAQKSLIRNEYYTALVSGMRRSNTPEDAGVRPWFKARKVLYAYQSKIRKVKAAA